MIGFLTGLAEHLLGKLLVADDLHFLFCTCEETP